PPPAASVPQRPCQKPVRHIISNVANRATIHRPATPPPELPPLTDARRCGNSGDITAHKTYAVGNNHDAARIRKPYSGPTAACAASGSCTPGCAGSANVAANADALPAAERTRGASAPAWLTIGISNNASAVAGVHVTLNWPMAARISAPWRPALR